MVVVKFIIRILLLPVRISLTIVQLVVMFITWLSATVFHILSGIICITAILGYGFGQETGTETIRMLVAGFVLYVLQDIDKDLRIRREEENFSLSLCVWSKQTNQELHYLKMLKT